MTKTRNLSDLLDSNGDVKSTALDNVPASNDASALTTGTLDSARLGTITNFTSTGIDDNATSTAVTIDSSQNVLVGKTSSGIGVAGFEFNAGTDSTYIVRDGGTALQVNRLTSDGELVSLKKDGTTVGSIGANTSSLYIAGTTRGLRFTASQLKATDASGNNQDNQFDLGATGARFKDLYLGGNIYLGGTGSANALDDYEEGTFTPTFGGATTDPTVSWNIQSGHYTKIGNIVHFNLTFYPSAISGGSGNLNIRGLPFTNRNHRAPASIIFDRVRILSSSTGIHPATVAAEVEQNTTYMAITAMNDAADEVRTFVQVSDLEAAPSDNPYIVIAGTYTTD